MQIIEDMIIYLFIYHYFYPSSHQIFPWISQVLYEYIIFLISLGAKCRDLNVRGQNTIYDNGA